MLDEKQWEQYGFPRNDTDVRGILLQETVSIMSAQEYVDELENGSDHYACHYICDKNEIIQLMPLDYGVYHVGTGRSPANESNIVIGLCSALSDSDFNLALSQAVLLIRELKQQYSIAYDRIYFLKDFSSKKYNPKTLLMRYGSSKRFAYETLLEEE